MKTKTKPSPLTIIDGVVLAQALEPGVREVGYHTLLGGGVLHRGYSEKDIDLWFLPLTDNINAKAEVVIKVIEEKLKVKLEPLFNPAYVVPNKYPSNLSAWQANLGGMRIDIFIHQGEGVK